MTRRGPYRMHAPDAVPCPSFRTIAGRDYPCQREQPRTRTQHSAHQFKVRAKGYEITIDWFEIMPQHTTSEGETAMRTKAER